MTQRSRRLVVTAVVAVAAGLLMVPSAAFAAGPGGGNGGGGGRGSGSGGGGAPGQGEEPTTANNLSVPTIFIPNGTSFNLNCETTPGPTDPTTEPSTGYPLSPGSYYYVQGVNTWQAQCATATTASVNAAWGANLTGAASLTTKHPIRVEMALSTSATTSMTGYEVVKLDPNALDRVSAYGTLASGTPETGFTATQTTFENPGVWDSGGGFTITNAAGTPVASSTSAEINATGRVVYGYNFSAPSPGDYTITFTAPAVTIDSANGGAWAGDTATLQITVGSGSGGGNGGGPGNGGRGGGNHAG